MNNNEFFEFIIAEIKKAMSHVRYKIDGIVEKPDLSAYEKQESESEYFGHEYVDQHGDGDFTSFYGTVLFQFSDNKYIQVSYWDY